MFNYNLNKAIKKDCLYGIKEIDEKSIDLIYLDPPFFTQKNHKLLTKDRTKEFLFTDIWNSAEDYASFLHSRMMEMHRVLKDSGSIFFHCDKSATHIVRFLLNNILENNFLDRK